MLSSKQKEERDIKILAAVNIFVENGCRMSDEEIGKSLGLPSSSVGRYLTSERTKELIGINNYAFIKRERNKNRILGRKKGGSHRKND